MVLPAVAASNASSTPLSVTGDRASVANQKAFEELACWWFELHVQG